jgi:hypothetical protein
MENNKMIAIRRYALMDPLHSVTVFADRAVGSGTIMEALTEGRLVAIFAFDGRGGRIEIASNEVPA